MPNRTDLPKIDPSEVFYYFDAPVIFTSKFGPFTALFVKSEDNEDFSTYLVSIVNARVTEGLRRNRLSVRGALLSSGHLWQVEAEHDYTIKAFQEISLDDLTPNSLPEPGYGIQSSESAVPDVLDREGNFLTVYFQGRTLRSELMRYSTFKRIADNLYSCVRSAIIPSALMNARGTTFDFMIREPAFGSLLFEIKEPIWNPQNVRKYRQYKGKEPADVARLIDSETVQNRELFIQQVDSLRSALDARDLERAATEEFAAYKAIQSILLDRRGLIDAVTISIAGLENQKLSFRAEQLEAVSEFIKQNAGKDVYERGRVIQVNIQRSTVIIQSIRGKEVTCEFGPQMFADLRGRKGFDLGSRVTLQGSLVERKRRDRMTVAHIINVDPSGISAEPD